MEKAKEVHDELEVDIAAYNKHRLNMQDQRNVNGFNQLFKGSKADIQSVVAHNIHEDLGCMQKGGTSLMAFGNITGILPTTSRKDEMGLGHWLVMTFKGEKCLTCMVCG